MSVKDDVALNIHALDEEWEKTQGVYDESVRSFWNNTRQTILW
jgi:hypothetical protein